MKRTVAVSLLLLATSAEAAPTATCAVETAPRTFAVDRACVWTHIDVRGGLPPTLGKIVPEVRESRMVGFRFFAIRPGSLLAQLGFQNGDLIREVDGIVPASPEVGLELYERFKTRRKLTVSVERKGNVALHVYRLR